MFSSCREHLFRRWNAKPESMEPVADFARLKRQPGRVENATYLGALLCAVMLFFSTLSLGAHGPERVLRVAADPNNLPFSNQRLEGFENRLAELVAAELGAKLEYMWWPQRRGFFRETIGSGRADLVIGVPEGFERVLTTRPYYRSSYVFVSRHGGASAAVRTLDDPSLREMKIGVQMIGDDFNNTPPAHALSRRGMINNIRGYSLCGDYAQDSPPSEIVKAVTRGEIDLAVAWGPMAGYFAARQAVPLDVVVVSPEQDGPMLPLTYAIAMGVRRGDAALKEKIDDIIASKQPEINRILADFNVLCLPLKEGGKDSSHVAE